MSTRTRAEVRQDETARLAAALAAADAGLKGAAAVWGVWADTVRQDVEQRLGVTYGDGDLPVLEDQEFGAALDVGTEIDRVREALDSLLRVAYRAGIRVDGVTGA
jgi:hypothetical protein